MTTARPSAQIGATHATPSQTQAGSGSAQIQQGGQQTGAGQIQQTGQTQTGQTPNTRFTDWASI